MRCYSCFNDVESSTQCPLCGETVGGQHENERWQLPRGTSLHSGHYLIGRVLGQGGFGITYVAQTTRPIVIVDQEGNSVVEVEAGGVVAIKECFPEAIVVREGLRIELKDRSNAQANEDFNRTRDRFQEEIFFLRDLRPHNSVTIVKYYDSFFENNTNYLVMEYVDGINLEEYRNRAIITSKTAEEIVEVVIGALRLVHRQGTLHRDVSPRNIMVRRSNSTLVLIDFGSARQHYGVISKSIRAFVSDGFSPMELYQSNTPKGVYTDIYSLAATHYFLLTGERPADAMRRMSAQLNGHPDPLITPQQFVGALDSSTSETLLRALELDPKRRIQNTEDYLNGLRGISASPSLIVARHSLFEKVCVVAIIVLTVLLCGCLVYSSCNR
jgi:serine/threonine protein kinase